MQFSLFRISANLDATLFHQQTTDAARLQAILDAFASSPQAMYRNEQYGVYNVDQFTDGVSGRLARNDAVELSSQSDDNPTELVDRTEPAALWTYFLFFGIAEHLLLVQRKEDFFSGTDHGLARIVELLLRPYCRKQGLDISVFPVMKQGTFWEQIDRLSRVKRIDFEFVAPNMFGGRQELASLLQMQKDIHQANIFRAGIQSNDGTLKFPRNTVTEAEVKYAEAGGGRWRIKGRDKSGKLVSVKSDSDRSITIDFPDEPDVARPSLAGIAKDLISRTIQMLGGP